MLTRGLPGMGDLPASCPRERPLEQIYKSLLSWLPAFHQLSGGHWLQDRHFSLASHVSGVLTTGGELAKESKGTMWGYTETATRPLSLCLFRLQRHYWLRKRIIEK